MKFAALMGGLALVVLAVGAFALSIWLQPRSVDEAACYWLQRQIDGDTGILDKIACKRGTAELAAERAEQERIEIQEEAQRQLEEAERQREVERRRAQADAARRAEQACVDAVDDQHTPRIDELEERWQELNWIPPDISEDEYQALVEAFDEIDRELQSETDAWLEAQDRCVR